MQVLATNHLPTAARFNSSVFGDVSDSGLIPGQWGRGWPC